MMTHFGTAPIRVPANQIAQRAKHFQPSVLFSTVARIRGSIASAILIGHDVRHVRAF